MTDDARVVSEVWPSHARRWELLGPPLRPGPDDVAVVEAIAREPWSPPPRVLLLGVTPELATLAWPAGTSFMAVDGSETMIDAVWPRAGTPGGAKAVLGDWRALPIEDASVDLALGDASFSVLDHPRGSGAVLGEVSRVLRAAGRFAVRVLVPPAHREDVHAIARDLWAGRVENLHALKIRLWMALQTSPERGVRLGDAWDAWRAMCPDPGELVTKLGWRADVLTTIDVYRDSETRYASPTLDELDAVAREASFDERVVHAKRYALGELCPTIVWRKRSAR